MKMQMNINTTKVQTIIIISFFISIGFDYSFVCSSDVYYYVYYISTVSSIFEL